PKDPLNLKPVTRTKPTTEMADTKPMTRTKSSKSEDARANRDAADKMAKQFDKALTGLQSGFNQGTKIEVGGPGGEAFADYGQYVKQIYDDAWVLPPDLLLDSGATVVKVTISRDGRVVHASIVDKSGQRQLDQ